MPGRLPICFGGCAAGGPPPPPSSTAGPSLTTSTYETRLGLAAFTWSRAALGLTLRADLRLSEDEEPLRFRVRPWLLWKRRGSRRFRLRDHPRHRCVDFEWDLSRARFQTGGRPEPAAGFFVAVAVDGEVLLVTGDLVEEAYKKTRAGRPKAPFSNPAPASRQEHVVLGDPSGRRSCRTMARFGGRDREISIDLGGKEKEREAGMAVAVDGVRVLQVKRLRWKFRGSEKVEVDKGGARMQISWDLHDWLFQPKDNTATADKGRAVFVFRFEEEEEEEEEVSKRLAEGQLGKGFGGKHEGHFGTTLGPVHSGKQGRNWSDSSSNGCGGAAEMRMRHRRRSSLLKASSSSSSTSSASSSSSSTVMEWASQEEAELQRSDGFSLLVYVHLLKG